jgi:hypothetical protein
MRREQEEDYFGDSRDAVDGHVTDSDEEFQAIVEVDELVRELLA